MQVQEPHETMDDIKRPVLPNFFPTFRVLHLWDAGCMLGETVLPSDNIVMEFEGFRSITGSSERSSLPEVRSGTKRQNHTVVSCAMRSVSFNASTKHTPTSQISERLANRTLCVCYFQQVDFVVQKIGKIGDEAQNKRPDNVFSSQLFFLGPLCRHGVFLS